MLLEGITDAVTTPVATRGWGIRTVTWAELRVLLLGIVTLAVTARNLLLTGSQLALTRCRWCNLWRCFCTLTERGCTLWRATIYSRRSVSRWVAICGRVAIWRHLAG